MLIIIILLLPVAAVPVALIASNRKQIHAVSIVLSGLMLIFGGILAANVAAGGAVDVKLFTGLRVDELSIIILGIVLLIGFLTSVYTAGYIEAEGAHGGFNLRRTKIYSILTYLFIFTMVLALTAANMGVMWVAIEATTISSAFLVGFSNDRRSLEAAWKYMIICSVGIALAMLGIIFLHIAAGELNWAFIVSHAGPDAFDKPSLRLAFIFILAGFGTKAGLAPMHTWLPDAHSQAPAPTSALLSGVLLNSAMYGILRALAIINRSLDPAFATNLLIASGFLSIAVAAGSIITQKDYKRLLAYSSIEHMGIISIGLGLLNPAAALLHMINHSFTKSALFLASGNIFLKYGTRDISRVKSLLKHMPWTGAIFLTGMLAITGMPPFSIFTSEFGIMVTAFKKWPWWAGTGLVLLLSLVFAGVVIAAFRMFFGVAHPAIPQPGNPHPAILHSDSANAEHGHAEHGHTSGEPNRLGMIITLFLIAIITITGLFVPDVVSGLLEKSVLIINGSGISIPGGI
jgi:hydrogenase-4 component F